MSWGQVTARTVQQQRSCSTTLTNDAASRAIRAVPPPSLRMYQQGAQYDSQVEPGCHRTPMKLVLHLLISAVVD